MNTRIELVGAVRRVVGPSERSIPKLITKLADGGMQIDWKDGRTTVLGKDDIEIQAFAVYVMAGDHQDGTC